MYVNVICRNHVSNIVYENLPVPYKKKVLREDAKNILTRDVSNICLGYFNRFQSFFGGCGGDFINFGGVSN